MRTVGPFSASVEGTDSPTFLRATHQLLTKGAPTGQAAMFELICSLADLSEEGCDGPYGNAHAGATWRSYPRCHLDDERRCHQRP